MTTVTGRYTSFSNVTSVSYDELVELNSRLIRTHDGTESERGYRYLTHGDRIAVEHVQKIMAAIEQKIMAAIVAQKFIAAIKSDATTPD